ncbi:hypothetical protein JXA32_08825 [Candidatus Sumerlaeota bacterium]|nr:hypothetical protein [Candidatus Sumerlaeota bacterium]
MNTPRTSRPRQFITTLAALGILVALTAEAFAQLGTNIPSWASYYGTSGDDHGNAVYAYKELHNNVVSYSTFVAGFKDNSVNNKGKDAFLAKYDNDGNLCKWYDGVGNEHVWEDIISMDGDEEFVSLSFVNYYGYEFLFVIGHSTSPVSQFSAWAPYNYPSSPTENTSNIIIKYYLLRDASGNYANNPNASARYLYGGAGDDFAVDCFLGSDGTLHILGASTSYNLAYYSSSGHSYYNVSTGYNSFICRLTLGDGIPGGGDENIVKCDYIGDTTDNIPGKMVVDTSNNKIYMPINNNYIYMDHGTYYNLYSTFYIKSINLNNYNNSDESDTNGSAGYFDYARDIALNIDDEGNRDIYITGQSNSPRATGATAHSYGEAMSEEFILIKYDADLDKQWSTQFGYDGTDTIACYDDGGWAIDLDPDGYPHVYGSATITKVQNSVSYTQHKSLHGQFTPDGELITINTYGSDNLPSDSYGLDLDVVDYGHAVMTGYATSGYEVVPGLSASGSYSGGGSDMFVQKIMPATFTLDGNEFIPLGYSWCHIEDDEADGHHTAVNFRNSYYTEKDSSGYIDDFLDRCQTEGYNLIRVYVDAKAVTENPPAGETFNINYIDNMVKFMIKANSRDIVVELSAWEVPQAYFAPHANDSECTEWHDTGTPCTGFGTHVRATESLVDLEYQNFIYLLPGDKFGNDTISNLYDYADKYNMNQFTLFWGEFMARFRTEEVAICAQQSKPRLKFMVNPMVEAKFTTKGNNESNPFDPPHYSGYDNSSNADHYARCVSTPPFDGIVSQVTLAGTSTPYDTTTPEGKEQLADALTIRWANACKAAIIAPYAGETAPLVGNSVFSNYRQRRPVGDTDYGPSPDRYNAVEYHYDWTQYPGGAGPVETITEARVPLSPFAFNASNFDCTGVHFNRDRYPWADGETAAAPYTNPDEYLEEFADRREPYLQKAMRSMRHDGLGLAKPAWSSELHIMGALKDEETVSEPKSKYYFDSDDLFEKVEDALWIQTELFKRYGIRGASMVWDTWERLNDDSIFENDRLVEGTTGTGYPLHYVMSPDNRENLTGVSSRLEAMFQDDTKEMLESYFFPKGMTYLDLAFPSQNPENDYVEVYLYRSYGPILASQVAEPYGIAYKFEHQVDGYSINLSQLLSSQSLSGVIGDYALRVDYVNYDDSELSIEVNNGGSYSLDPVAPDTIFEKTMNVYVPYSNIVYFDVLNPNSRGQGYAKIKVTTNLGTNRTFYVSAKTKLKVTKIMLGLNTYQHITNITIESQSRPDTDLGDEAVPVVVHFFND